MSELEDRCFCGHLVDVHSDEGEGPCEIADCSVSGEKCKFFVSLPLAATRMLGVIASELTNLRRIMGQPLGEIPKIFH